MRVNKIIRDFIQSELVKDENLGSLKDTDDLLESGIIDSLGIQILLAYLEETLSIQIPEDDLIPENFETIEAISRLVQDKMA